MKSRWSGEGYRETYRMVCALLYGEQSRPWIQDVLEKVKLPEGAKVIELGCGSGKFSCAYAMLGYESWAVDFLPERLEQVKKNFPNMNIRLVQSELPELRGVPRNSFSLAFSEGVAEHFLDYGERIGVIRAHRSVCKEGGHVCIFVPFRSQEADEHCYWNPGELRLEMEEAGLKDVDIYPFYFIGETGIKRYQLRGIGRV